MMGSVTLLQGEDTCSVEGQKLSESAIHKGRLLQQYQKPVLT